MVSVKQVELHGVFEAGCSLDQSQSEKARIEIHIRLNLPRDHGDVVDAKGRCHAFLRTVVDAAIFIVSVDFAIHERKNDVFISLALPVRHLCFAYSIGEMPQASAKED